MTKMLKAATLMLMLVCHLHGADVNLHEDRHFHGRRSHVVA